MGKRLKLSDVLHEILGNGNVYFQPPASFKMKFPCIVYEKNGFDTTYADNKPYHINEIYKVTYIDSNPDSDIPEKLANLSRCKPGRIYVSDNRYHSPFTIIF